MPDDTYNEFEQYRQADDPDADDVSKADAGRRLLETGLDWENGELAATDGGAAVDKIEETQRENRIQNGLIGAGLVAGVVAIASDNPALLLLAGAVGLLLTVWSFYPILRAEVAARTDREVSPDA